MFRGGEDFVGSFRVYVCGRVVLKRIGIKSELVLVVVEEGVYRGTRRGDIFFLILAVYQWGKVRLCSIACDLTAQSIYPK